MQLVYCIGDAQTFVQDSGQGSTKIGNVLRTEYVPADRQPGTARIQRFPNHLEYLLIAGHAWTSCDKDRDRRRLDYSGEAFPTAGVHYFNEIGTELVADTGAVGIERFTELDTQLWSASVHHRQKRYIQGVTLLGNLGEVAEHPAFCDCADVDVDRDAIGTMS